MARRVEGLRSGLYHYAADAHQLERVRARAGSRQIRAYLAGQHWFDGATAVMLMTAVLPRTMWKYSDAGAYRNICIEAGHLGQTFCLIAERAALAPFCTRALADSRIERDLGIDGIGETIIYVVGVGTRPRSGKWTLGGERPPAMSTRGLRYAVGGRANVR